MPNFRSELFAPKHWKIIGSIIVYFVLIKDVPDTLRMFKVGSLLSLEKKKALLVILINSDFWYILLFTFCLAIVLMFLLFRSRPSQESPNTDFVQKGIKYLKRVQIIRAVRSFGLVPLREWIMDQMDIAIYGTFKRPSSWFNNSRSWGYVDRITFKSGKGLEYQYAKNFSNVFVREHSETVDTYGPGTTRKPNWIDIKYLFIASWYFPFWLVIHLLRRPFK